MIENFSIKEQDISDLNLIDTCIDMYFEGDEQALRGAIEKFGRDRVIALMFAHMKARYGKKLIACTMLRRDRHYDQSSF